MSAKLLILLHYHIPYVRKRGVWPYGEEWIFEALLGCYLPLLTVFRELSPLGVKNAITCSITPILAEQLSDPYMKIGFASYMDKRKEMTRLDIRDFEMKGWFELAHLAGKHLEKIDEIGSVWKEIGGDFIGAMRELESSSVIEIGSSSATHGILPLLDTKSVKNQLEIGIKSATRHFGHPPFSFWLPECAYKPGLEKHLQDYGIKCVFLDSAALTGRFETPATSMFNGLNGTMHSSCHVDAKGTTFKPYFIGQSSVAFMARNFDLSKQVWSAREGYPGDYRYREFHKRYERSGNRYWRVTGDKVDLGDKQVYQIDEALSIAKGHASHFVSRVTEVAYSQNEGDLVFLSFDAELFGHWWHEGVPWLKEVLLKASQDKYITLSTPSKYLGGSPPSLAARPPSCTWGDCSDLRTWLQPETSWMWDELSVMSAKFFELSETLKDRLALAQLQRELLLAQSSDWEFLVTTRQARMYGEDRFRVHAKAFWDLVDLIARGGERSTLAKLVETDNPFPFLSE